ncbi:hypothetical protein Peur_031793 [Populus x canadensis]
MQGMNFMADIYIVEIHGHDKREYSLLNAEASEEERNEALEYLLDHYQELFSERVCHQPGFKTKRFLWKKGHNQ